MNKLQAAMKEAAYKYLALGYSVIPISGSAKIPPSGFSWKQFQERQATPEEVDKWFEKWPNMNIGIVTGIEVVVIDIDPGATPAGFSPTVTARTPRGGWHLYYKQPEYEVKTMAGYRDHIDSRGSGGYVVAAPSEFSKTEKYTWEVDPFENECAPFPDLPDIKRAETTQPSGTAGQDFMVPVGKRHDVATAYVGSMLSRVDPEDWEKKVWPRLKLWNVTVLSEPLPMKELQSIFDGISKKEMSKRFIEEKDSSEETGSSAFTLSPVSLSALYEEKDAEVKWLVEGLIQLGAITIITGDSGSFKSFLMQSLGGNLIAGTPFLEHFETIKGKVLFVDEENPRSTTKKRFEELGVAASEDMMFVVQSGFLADQAAHVKKLAEYVKQFKPTLVVFDSLVDIHKQDENRADQMNIVFKLLRSKLLTPDLAIILIHHHRKSPFGGKQKASDSIRGSTGILAAMDGHIAVDRSGGNDVVLTQNKVRTGVTIPPFRVTLTLRTDGHGLSFLYQGEDHSAAEAFQLMQEEVLRVLSDATEKMSIESLLVEVHGTDAKIRAVLAQLVSGGVVGLRKVAHGKGMYFLPGSAADPDGPSEQLVVEENTDDSA